MAQTLLPGLAPGTCATQGSRDERCRGNRTEQHGGDTTASSPQAPLLSFRRGEENGRHGEIFKSAGFEFGAA